MRVQAFVTLPNDVQQGTVQHVKLLTRVCLGEAVRNAVDLIHLLNPMLNLVKL